MRTTLQKRPKFGMKMAESWPFMDQFPPNHHRISFLVHNNYSVKSKRKKLKKLGLTFFCHDAHAPKWPKFGMKMAESWLFMDQFPPNHHRMSVLVHENHSIKYKGNKKEIEVTRPKSIFLH